MADRSSENTSDSPLSLVLEIQPSIELLWQLEKIRRFVFDLLHVIELESLCEDTSILMSSEALDLAKQNDVDGASHSDNTTIQVNKILEAPSIQSVLNEIIVELKDLLPDVDANLELSGNALYVRGAHLGWHSNHSRSDGRVYCSWTEKKDSNFFRYEHPDTGEIVTQWEQVGWNRH